MIVRWMFLSILWVPISASAGSLELAYASLERIIVEKALTEGGRHYLQGGPDDTCNYAFIQEPRVSAAESRLNIRFLFAGSLGKQVGERCVGSGDNFDIVVSGVPRFADGEIVLDDMKIDGESRVFSLFSGLITRVMGSMMRVPVRQELTTSFGQLVVKGIDVGEIALGESSLTVTTDVDLAIQPAAGAAR